jgi:hypothetical protein
MDLEESLICYFGVFYCENITVHNQFAPFAGIKPNSASDAGGPHLFFGGIGRDLQSGTNENELYCLFGGSAPFPNPSE